jgi:hypothetical protein
MNPNVQLLIDAIPNEFSCRAAQLLTTRCIKHKTQSPMQGTCQPAGARLAPQCVVCTPQSLLRRAMAARMC